MNVVRQAFRPEFLNRLDDILMFSRLTAQDMDGVVHIQLRGLQQALARQNMTLHLTPQACAWLAHEGYEPLYGARPLRRVIQKHLIDPLSTMILDQKLQDGDTIQVQVSPQGLVLDIRAPQA